MSSKEYRTGAGVRSAADGASEPPESRDRLAVSGPGARALAQQRTYTLQPGDTLSGIAAKLGLPGWQRLYDANVGTIGPNSDLIQPGQALVVPCRGRTLSAISAQAPDT